MKPGGKFVLDVPNSGSPVGKIAMKIEAFLGRPDNYNFSTIDFEQLLLSTFHIHEKKEVGPMFQYYLTVKA